MNSLHDYEILNYNINFKNSLLTMDVTNEDSNKRIEFVGAIAHQFSDEIPYSIILDLDELDMKHFFSSNKDLLEEKKNSGWPLICSSVEELEKMLQESDIRYYVLYSSYGMTGWVLAERVEIIDVK
ncbi:hypothetical protein [Enterococcus ureasiticus]|uniref:Uncharacterized protein n=1 Tax=Enterococcus ureasiticus TaxID=903984 RepID=A0A1E5GL37_9ENTE|nr:hypothetical protein [Enterococcus ureasiticus]OEG13436.1 hypothetical protein BCR21_00115 [Enterococcus ureasiticus]